MKKYFLLILCVFFAFIISANAGELYHCIGSNGKSIITDTPQDGMTKCVLKDSYDDPTPQERAQQQRERSRAQYEDQIETNRRQQETNQGKGRVDLEKKWLQDRREKVCTGDARWSADCKKTLDEREKQLEKDEDQYFYNKEQREKEAVARPVARRPAPAIPRGAIDVNTGQVYTPAAGGVVDPRTGTFYQDVGGGYVNTKTGDFSPKTSP